MAGSPNLRGSIPKAESSTLWAASAGRCNICSQSLLSDATTGVEVKAGEMAHIVGVSDGPRSPRGQHPLPKKERNKAENLILLCEKHHTEIDTRTDLYSAEYLRRLKREYEDRVFYLTGLGPERETYVLRMLGSIHGKQSDITREDAREIVLEGEGRYPRYALSATEHDVSIDLRQLTNEGSPSYWEQAEAKIADRVTHLRDLQAQGTVTHLSVLALGRIPALIMLGAALGDATNVTVYHRRQDGWGWDPEAPQPDFEIVPHATEGDTVTLACSLTGEVQLDRAPADTREGAVYEIRPSNAHPNPGLLNHPRAQGAFANAYREFLSMVERDHPHTKAVHLLPAVPGDAAIVLGRIRTPAVHPPLRVFDLDRDTSEYIFVCEVGA
jgi:hypothetical protein